MSTEEASTIPNCECNSTPESTDSNVYFHLGHGKDENELAELFEEKKVRMLQVYFNKIPSLGENGCPKAYEIVSRQTEEAKEDVLVLYRRRPSHNCKYSLFIVAIILWDANFHSRDQTMLFGQLTANLCHSRLERSRSCSWNRRRTCFCQGTDETIRGKSFAIGCSYSAFTRGCKFAGSQRPETKRFGRLSTDVVELINNWATDIAKLHKKMVPIAYANMIKYNNDCRIGNGEERPYSSLTVCSDFSAHNHRDILNTKEGCTAIYSMVPMNRRPEQLHVLPHYTKYADEESGGLGLVLTNGSLLFEYSRVEVHATTSVRQPNRLFPKRMSLVFYQQRGLNFLNHGLTQERQELIHQLRIKARLERQNKKELARKRNFLYNESSINIDETIQTYRKQQSLQQLRQEQQGNDELKKMKTSVITTGREFQW